MIDSRIGALLIAASFVGVSGPARAEIAVSANDAHTVLDNGNQVGAAGKADTLSVIDLSGPPRVVATIDAPTSVVGPPSAVWVAPDESWAISTGATKLQDGAPGGIGPDNQVSVIELGPQPKIVQSLTAGAGATSVRVSPDGTVAIVVNRTAGTLSVFTVKDKRLTAAGTVAIDAKAMPSGLGFLPDGKTALLSRYGDHQVSVLHVDGTAVTVDKRPLTTGIAPYTLDISPDGKLAAVSNMGRGDGDVDSVSLIDLGAQPMRVVQTLDVGRSPEGLKWSPDGRFLAVGCQNGTTKPPSDALFQPAGRLLMLALNGGRLHQVTEAPIGQWTQGIAFSRDGGTMLVQDMVGKRLQVFGWNGTALTPRADVALGAGPAAIGTAWR